MTRISQGWVGSDVEARIAAHVHAWEKIKPLGDKRRLETYPFVAVSREFGCEALPLAQKLVETLNERCRPSSRGFPTTANCSTRFPRNCISSARFLGCWMVSAVTR